MTTWYKNVTRKQLLAGARKHNELHRVKLSGNKATIAASIDRAMANQKQACKKIKSNKKHKKK